MAALSPLIALLDEADRAEALGGAEPFAELAEQAAIMGQVALALKAFAFARRRGLHRAPTLREWQVLQDYEQLPVLVDRAAEYQRVDLLESVCRRWAGHPDLHSHAVNACFLLEEMGHSLRLDPVERRNDPEERDLMDALLAGDPRLLGWGLRQWGAGFADRMIRMGLRGVEPLLQYLPSLAQWVEVLDGPEAATPYYRCLWEAKVGGEEIRVALVLAAARGNRRLAQAACDLGEERSRLGLWVLQRGLDSALDPAWLEDLDPGDLNRLLDEEAERLASGSEPRVKASDLSFSAELAGRFQSLFLAHGRLAEAITCLEIRMSGASGRDRAMLLQTQASLLMGLGRDQQASRSALEAFHLDPTDAVTQDLLLDLGQQQELSVSMAQAFVQQGRELQEPSLMLAGASLAGPHRESILEELAAMAFPVETLIQLATDQAQKELGLALLAELAELGRLNQEQQLAVVRDLVAEAKGDHHVLEQALRLLDSLAEDDQRVQRVRAVTLLELGRGRDALVVMHEAELPEEGAWAVHRARALLLTGDEAEAASLLVKAEADGNQAAKTLLAELEGQA